MDSYHIELTLPELEEVERALLVYQDHIRKYEPEIRDEAQRNISSIINKLNKA